MQLLTQCSHCRGTGTADLAEAHPHLLDTFQVLGKGREAALSAREVHEKLRATTSKPAINGRLEDLRRHGLVERITEGRNVRYYIPEPKRGKRK